MTWRTRSPAQNFAYVFGMIYLLIGILGFIIVPDSGDELFGVFSLNVPHSIAHGAIGLALLFSSGNRTNAKRVNLIVGIVYGVLAVLGFVNVVVNDWLKANAADDFLHLATATLAIFFGTIGAEGERSRV